MADDNDLVTTLGRLALRARDEGSDLAGPLAAVALDRSLLIPAADRGPVAEALALTVREG